MPNGNCHDPVKWFKQNAFSGKVFFRVGRKTPGASPVRCQKPVFMDCIKMGISQASRAKLAQAHEPDLLSQTSGLGHAFHFVQGHKDLVIRFPATYCAVLGTRCMSGYLVKFFDRSKEHSWGEKAMALLIFPPPFCHHNNAPATAAEAPPVLFHLRRCPQTFECVCVCS